MLLMVVTDYATCGRAGEPGAFQIASLEDENGADLSGKVDQRIHFHNEHEATDYLKEVFGRSARIDFVHQMDD